MQQPPVPHQAMPKLRYRYLPPYLHIIPTNQTQTNARHQWFCEGDSGISLDANGFPSSTCSTHLQTLLYFPQCVNTATLETAYKSKTYGTTNYCPKGYNSMSQLRFSIRYDLRKALPKGWTGTAPLKLACGNAFCSHGMSFFLLTPFSFFLILPIPIPE